LTNLPNTTTYTDAEALYACQIAWQEMYSKIIDQNDDYFVTSLYVASSTFTADANRSYMYLYALPSDFYALRLLQYQLQGGSSIQYQAVYKATIEEFGNTQNTPAYRFQGTNLAIYDPIGYTSYALWYYPKPATLALSTDLTYPNNVILEILTYQIAIEMRRKQRADVLPWEARKIELEQTMSQTLKRDANKSEKIRDTFTDNFYPYR
jgi:hypothetical protein